MERITGGGGDAFHGSGGELRVEKQRLRWAVLDLFADAAEQSGMPRSVDFNTGDNLGSGSFVRCSAARAFLRPALKRPNLRVVTDALINRVVFEGSRAAGVEFSVGGERSRASSRIETVLAAGSIGSPAILQRSGFGDSDRLSALGVRTIRHMPGIGRNLQDHLQLRSVYQIEGLRSLNLMANSTMGKMLMGLEYLWRRSGPLSMAPSTRRLHQIRSVASDLQS